MKTYMTPDFDVTVYEIKDVITLDVGGDDEWNDSMGYYGGSDWDE